MTTPARPTARLLAGLTLTLTLPALALVALSGAAAPAGAAERPNVIVIMADDLGYGDVGCYGATAVKTPHIDRLAAEGLRFTQGYCSASTCTPTRYSFLTGTYAFRQKGTGIGGINATALIQPGTATVASVLKGAGYATGVIGKWHLGLGSPPGPDWNGVLKPGPLEIGFDYCFLLPNTNDRVPSVYVENHRVLNLDPADPITVSRKNPDGQPTAKENRDQLKMDWSHGHNSTVHNGIGRIGFMSGGHRARWRDEDNADDWVERSRQWIADHAGEPFFLFFSSHEIHVPRMPHERFHGKSGLGFRGDAILSLDWCVGELLKSLKEHDLEKKTLIVFCSDNGPVLDDGYKDGAVTQLGDHKPAGPLSGGKYQITEGGTRTPFITWWPGRIQPGTSDKVVCTIDLAASLAALTGQELGPDDCLDSFNLLPALLGETGAAGRDHLVQQPNQPDKAIALRVGDWKLHQRGKKQALYNLAEDLREENDLASAYPDKLTELGARLEKIRQSGRSRE